MTTPQEDDVRHEDGERDPADLGDADRGHVRARGGRAGSLIVAAADSLPFRWKLRWTAMACSTIRMMMKNR